MTKQAVLCAALALAVLMAGCTVRSLQPLYTGKDLTFDTRLLGSWGEADSKETWTLAKSGDNAYELSWAGDKGQTETVEARLVRLGEMRFLDLYPRDVDESFSIKAHVVVKVQIRDEKLQVALLNPDWLKDALDRKAVQIAHVNLPDTGLFVGPTQAVIVTASTKELQDFVKAYANDEKAFPVTEMRRK